MSMFDMDEFMEELNQETSALEAMISQMDEFGDDSDPALEGLFRKPKSVEKLLAQLKKTIDKKCKTMEDCDAMLENLSNDEIAFNTALSNMKEAAQQFQAGEITKKEMSAKIKPETKKLKKTCTMLSLKDINDKTDNVTDEELQNLRDVLVGAKDAIKAKKEELSGSTASEGFIGGFEGDEDGIAQEALTEVTAGIIGAGAYLGLVVLIVSLGAFLNKNSKVCKEAIKDMKKEIKPKMKQLKNELKQAKKNKDYGKCVSILQQMETLNKKMKSVIDKLTPEREDDARKTDANGKTTELKKIKQYNASLAMAADKYNQEMDYIKQQIVLYTNKAKNEGPANEAAYQAGFQAAIEAMMLSDETLDSEDFDEEDDSSNGE